jgi:anthranilate synthase component 2
MKIAVINNYDSFVYNLVRYLREESGGEVQVYRNDEVKLESLQNVDGIVLSPGPGLPKDAGLMPEIIARYHTQIPILGICLGHQALGEFFGATLVQQDKPLHGKQSRIRNYRRCALLHDLPDEIEVGRYHSWNVELSADLPLDISCTSEDGYVMGIKHRSLPLHGLQFHPESVLTPLGRQMIRNWIYSLQSKKA